MIQPINSKLDIMAMLEIMNFEMNCLIKVESILYL